MLRAGLKRILLKNYHYYSTVILSLGFTLCMIFSVFSILDSVYLKTLPYGDAEQLYHMDGSITYNGRLVDSSTNPHGLWNIKQNSRLVESFSLYLNMGSEKLFDLPGRPEVDVFYTSYDFFSTLKLAPVAGRFFNKQEKLESFQPSAILSFHAWETYFLGNLDVIGQKIQIGQRRFTVIGIAPDEMAIPRFESTNQGIWLPLDFSHYSVKSFGGFTSGAGAILRMTDGASIEQVQQESDPLYYAGAETVSPVFTKQASPTTRVVSLISEIRGDSEKMIIMLIVGVTLLAFMALVNLGNVQIARAVGRMQPLAISYAFGATRRQIFVETFRHNIIVIAIASLIGLALTAVSLSLIKDVASDFFPRMDTLGIGPFMLLFAVCLALLIAALFSVIEMRNCQETALMSNLQSSGKGTGKQLKKSVSHLLIGLQLCFSVLTLTATSQVLYTTLNEALRSNNINTDNLWNISVSYVGIDSLDERINLQRSVVEYLRNKSGVEVISYNSEMRVPGTFNSGTIYDEQGDAISGARQIRVAPEQFDLYQMSIEGRKFTTEDGELEAFPIIINQRIADKLSGNPIGQKIMLDKSAHEIIGVTSNTDYPGNSWREIGEVFMPGDYDGERYGALLLKVTPEFEGFNHVELTNDLITVDPRLDLLTLVSADKQFANLSQEQRFGAGLAAAIAVISMMMVIAGVVGMVSYMVTMGRYDMGVKMAMGASNREQMKSQLLELAAPISMAMLLAFSVLYFMLGYSRTQPDWLFNIHWSAFGYVLLLLSTVSIIACFIPISKVLKTDPIKALRNE